MKKWLAGFLALWLALTACAALAADHPFSPDVDYQVKYRENGAIPSMLNFGCAKLAPGEDLYDVDKITIKKEATETLEGWLDEGRMFYIYSKWQNDRGFDSYFIHAMLVMTDPEGNYYATYGEWDQGHSRRRAIYSWFFDVTDCLNRCRREHGGSLPKGEYTFSMFFNDKFFRSNRTELN